MTGDKSSTMCETGVNKQLPVKMQGKVTIFLCLSCYKFEHEILMINIVDEVILGIDITCKYYL